jgi:hypothetical protein
MTVRRGEDRQDECRARWKREGVEAEMKEALEQKRA